jgi:hypothetical protein
MLSAITDSANGLPDVFYLSIIATAVPSPSMPFAFTDSANGLPDLVFPSITTAAPSMPPTIKILPMVYLM